MKKTVAILGNPNSGKSSVFNRFTGLSAKVGNFPGVTVEKKIGDLKLASGQVVHIIDFPGVYSLHPNAKDEFIVTNILTNPSDNNYPDLVVYVADITHLEKQLLLFTQVIDLGLPVILVLTMKDLAEKDNLQFDIDALQKHWNIPIYLINARKDQDIPQLISAIEKELDKPNLASTTQYKLSYAEQILANEISDVIPIKNSYQALLNAHYPDQLNHIDPSTKAKIKSISARHGFNSLASQIQETLLRYDSFTGLIRAASKPGNFGISKLSDSADRILTHKWLGIIIFLLVNFFIFQAMFSWASYPMEWMEIGFGWLGEKLKSLITNETLSSFVSDGVLAGLTGILVFIPQIAILFFLLTILEDLGYMARAVYLFDRLLLKFGLNGRSLVSLIAGGACAIPAIMSTRTISNQKERLITILVTPFISCSARIPVYTILVGFVITSQHRYAGFNAQGLVIMGLYILGAITALIAGYILKKIIKSDERSHLMIELPDYKIPDFKVALQTAWSKAWAFVIEAGKVILIISMILWVLSSYGPKTKMHQVEIEVENLKSTGQLSEQAANDVLASKKLEASYAGIMGKWIEPAIKPLGFDWKIGIALLTSFAAREVFVATISTIYSLGSTEDFSTIQQRLAAEKNNETGLPRYNLAVSLSLLLFYVFAMQCMSTVAVVKRETGGWKWAIIQFVFMCAIAYLASFITYQTLS